MGTVRARTQPTEPTKLRYIWDAVISLKGARLHSTAYRTYGTGTPRSGLNVQGEIHCSRGNRSAQRIAALTRHTRRRSLIACWMARCDFSEKVPRWASASRTVWIANDARYPGHFTAIVTPGVLKTPPTTRVSGTTPAVASLGITMSNWATPETRSGV